LKVRTDTLALVLAVALAAPACGNFADPTTVVDLRVLAAKTSPPDVFLTVTGLPTDPSAPIDPSGLGIDPASIPAITLQPLIVDPRPAAGAITWDLSACPNNPYGPTPPASIMGGPANAGGGANTTVGSTLCDGAKLQWSFGTGLAADASASVQLTSDELLAAFRSDVYLDQYHNFHGGFDLGMPVNLQLTVHEPGVADIQAVKRVVFWGPLHPETPNQIPALTAVTTYADRDATTLELLDAAGPLDAMTPVHVSLASAKGLWLSPDYQPCDRDAPDLCADRTQERYTPIVINRDPPYQAIPGDMVLERIRYSYYATAGHFEPPGAVDPLAPGAEPTPGTLPGPHVESHYIPPASLDDVPADASGLHLVTVWVIVRDDRGGEAWLPGRLALDP
jgi:hypothetical protein